MRKPRLSSITMRLSTSIIPISLLGIFLIGMSAYYIAKRYVLENVKKEVRTLGSQATQNVASFFKQRENDLETVSETPLFFDYTNNFEFGLVQEAEAYRKEIEDYLQKFSARSGVYNGIWYLDRNGREIATIKRSKIVTQKGRVTNEHYLQSLAHEHSDGRFISPPITVPNLGPTVFYAKSLQNETGDYTNTIILGTSLHPIQEILDRLLMGPSGSAGLVDASKKPVFPLTPRAIDKIKNPNLFSEYSPVPGTPWRVAVFVDLNHFLKPLSYIRLLTTWMSLFCGLLVAFSIYSCVRLLIRPIKKLYEATQRLAAGSLEERVTVQSRDEVGALSHAFNEMAQTLQTRAEENKQLLENIRRSEARYRTTLDSSLDAIIGLDASFKITTWNRGAQKLFGYTNSEALEKSIAMLFPPAASEELMKQALSHGYIQNRDVDGTTKTGEMVNLNLTWAGSEKEAGKTKEWSLVIRDITEQKKLLAQLIQAEKLSVVGQLISGIAHEINGPLTAVVGYAELLMSNCKDYSRELKEDLKFIYDNSVRCRDIVSNFLRFVRRGKLKKKAIDLNETIQSALKLMQYRLVKKEFIELQCDLAPHLPLLSADAQQIEQVIVNLVHNACDALSEISGAKKIVLRTRLVDRSAVIQILDNGPGVPKNMQEKIFEPFFTTKEEGKGTGLGLAISQRIIQDHGGSIWVESFPGCGTTFQINLPASEEEKIVKTELEKTPLSPLQDE